MSVNLVVQRKNLFKTFDGKKVIHDCSMSVERGSIYGFLRKNGAGKSTVFKILLGLLKPSMGEATVLGLDSVKNNLDILKRTGSLIETPIFYEHLSAIENVQIHLDYMGITNANIAETLEMVGLFNIGKQSIAVTIIAAVIISTVMCQVMAMTMYYLVGGGAFLIIGTIGATIALKSIVGKVDKMEV